MDFGHFELQKAFKIHKVLDCKIEPVNPGGGGVLSTSFKIFIHCDICDEAGGDKKNNSKIFNLFVKLPPPPPPPVSRSPSTAAAAASQGDIRVDFVWRHNLFEREIIMYRYETMHSLIMSLQSIYCYVLLTRFVLLSIFGHLEDFCTWCFIILKGSTMN